MHRAAWGVEVAARHAVFECLDTPSAEPGLRDRLATADAALERELTEARGKAPETFLHAASGYHHFAEDAIREGVCLSLTRGEMRRRRLRWTKSSRTRGSSASDLDDLAEAGEQKRAGWASPSASPGRSSPSSCSCSPCGPRVAPRTHRRPASRPRPAPPGGRRRLQVPVVEAGGIAGSAPHARHRGACASISGDRSREAELPRVGLAHELRTPLAKVREALALLGDGSLGALNDRQQRVATLARARARRSSPRARPARSLAPVLGSPSRIAKASRSKRS